MSRLATPLRKNDNVLVITGRECVAVILNLRISFPVDFRVVTRKITTGQRHAGHSKRRNNNKIAAEFNQTIGRYNHGSILSRMG